MDTAACRPCRTLVVMRHDAVAGLDDAGCVERAARLESGNANHFSGLDRGSALDPLDIDIDSLDHRSGTRVDMGDEGEPGRGLRCGAKLAFDTHAVRKAHFILE